MSRPRKIPATGDVAPEVVAQVMSLSPAEFSRVLPELMERRPPFPGPDPTTGKFCIEAVQRWRLSRHASLFPELTATAAGVHAGAVFDERRRRLFGENRS